MAYDVIVIGAGHNGLTAAAYLARAGRRVLVLERRHIVGGAAVTEEVFPGYRVSVCSYVVSLLRPDIIRELGLRQHGLELLPLDGTYTPLPGGDYLWRTEDEAHTRQELARHSAADARVYHEYGRTMAAMAAFVKPLLDQPPPEPSALGAGDLLSLFGVGRRFRRLPARQRHALVQLMTMSAADFVERWFEFDPLQATLASSGIIGSHLGARSPGTAYVLLHHYMGEIDGVFRSWGFARGGMGSVSEAIAAAARAAGAEIRTASPVSRILMRGGRATGVVLENGDELRAPVVASSIDPHHTFLRLLDPRELPEDFVNDVRHYRFRGASAKVNLALDGLPDFTAPGTGDAHLRGAISLSPSMAYLDAAYEDSRAGRYSRRPYLDVVIPSLSDPSVAPPGKHLMSCFVQYAPYALADGSWDDHRDGLGDAVIDALAEYAPNMRSIVTARQVVTPLDLEREWGLTEGQIFQGEMTPDQIFFMRPAPGWARYATPVDGLYMCGAATHPGGGVMGAPGRNAARTILRQESGT
ncbi:MAG: phytoene desaturase family protein [Vicinamibacterales bacterium]